MNKEERAIGVIIHRQTSGERCYRLENEFQCDRFRCRLYDNGEFEISQGKHYYDIEEIPAMIDLLFVMHRENIDRIRQMRGESSDQEGK